MNTPKLIDDEGCCAICGSMMELEACHACDGEGGHHDCGEDTCACADPEEITQFCSECDGEGEYLVCMSLPHSEEQIEAWRKKEASA